MDIKIEQDPDHQYFVVSTFNRQIENAYQELADFLVQQFSAHFDFGFFLCEEAWQTESRLLHYFKLSKHKRYKQVFSQQQIAQHEVLIRHLLQNHLIQYCSHFSLDHTQIQIALQLNASQSSGRSFLYLQRKERAENQVLESDILFELSGGIQRSIDWDHLESKLRIQQVYPMQKWQACYELSIRLGYAD